MGKTYVIGNINGKYQELITLLEKMNLGITDKLYILGDTIGYRKGSLKALQFFMKMPNCVCIMGTQEFIMLQNRKTLEKLNRESKDIFRNNLLSLLEFIRIFGDDTFDEIVKLPENNKKEMFDYIKAMKTSVEINVNGQDYILSNAEIDRHLKNQIQVTAHRPTLFIKENPRPNCIYKDSIHIELNCDAFSTNGRLSAICFDNKEEIYSKDEENFAYLCLSKKGE